MFEQLRDAVEVLREEVARVDPSSIDGDQAAQAFELFALGERLCAAGRLLLSRRVHQTKSWQGSGHASAAAWMASRAGIPLGQAISALETSDAMQTLPATESAVRSGELSLAQAREVATAASADPSAETSLLEAASTKTVAGLRRDAHRVRAAARPDELTAYRAIHSTRYFRHWTDPEGAVRLDAKLTPDVGASVLADIAVRTSALKASARRAGRHEPAAAHAADALAELVCSGGPEGSGPRATVHVLVDHSAFKRGHTVPGERCEIPGIGPIPVATAEALASDAILKVLVTDGTDIRAVAHGGRTIPAKLRTALEVRDPECVLTDRDVTANLQIDHIEPWSNGGETSLENTERLCSIHHYLKTYCGYRIVGPRGNRRLLSPSEIQGPRPPPVQEAG